MSRNHIYNNLHSESSNQFGPTIESEFYSHPYISNGVDGSEESRPSISDNYFANVNGKHTSRSARTNFNRFPYRKSYGFIVVAIIVLVMSWEAQKMDAALAQGAIPEEAIRLRILANSDSPSDQMIKRIVRDEVVKAMNGWATGQQTIEEARKTIQAKGPELQLIVENVLVSRGFTYESQVELGLVHFPTKMYGSKVYSAGEYEALLITIGEGKGQNWWCVLFPPLCFIDAVSGEASESAATQTGQAEPVIEQAKSDTKTSGVVTAAALDTDADMNETPKVKFFILEILESIFNWFKSLL